MSFARRAALLLGAFAAAGLAATAADAGGDERSRRPELVGTYQRVAKDVVQPDGSLRDVYEDRLVTGGKSYKLTLPPTAHLHGGEPVRVRGRLAGADMAVEEVETLGAAPAIATTGTTKVLVILAHWSAPDSVTTAQAKSQILGDDDGWFGEASYGQLGLTGTATPWYAITAPTGGKCYANHMEIMDRAKAKAKTGGYDSALYDRTIVYFPRCGGDASGAAGWAYQPGTEVWLNGYMDRRVSVHEQGHNYGLPHAHTYTCTSGATRVTLGGSCYSTEYGDDYDAMGGSIYSAHFSAPQKDSLGWLAGRKRTLTSTETTFTLPPFEKAGATPLAAVAGTTVATRKYWIEYRQAVGYDDALPSGATAGVLVHLRDSAISAGGGPFLLDMSPQNAFGDAVIPPGGAWTSPEGVRISVGTVSATGAVVTVKGGVDPPTVPTVPRNVTATGGDGSVRLTWDPPASNGGATVQTYVVTRTPGGAPEELDAASTTLTVDSLTNGTEYAFTVAARNSAGAGPASLPAVATPAAQLPSVALTSPADGATVGGTVTIAATATPHPVADAPVEYVAFEVDGQEVDWDYDAPYTTQWDSTWAGDGEHTITATAYDTAWRYQTSAARTVTVATPRPSVAITKPTGAGVITDDIVTLEATATPVPGGAPISWVSYELADGTTIGYGSTAPYTAEWDASLLNGTFEVVAKAYDDDGRSGTSAPVSVTLSHPVPSVALTAPAEGATVVGNAVPVTATAAPAPGGQPVDRVEFYADNTTYVGTDWDAPYEATWDTSALAGPHTLSAVVHDQGGRSAASPPRTVDVANPLPSVAITTPADFAVVDGLLQVAATATPHPDSGSPIERVVITLDDWTQLADVAAPGPYTTTWDATGGYGKHTLVATAFDAAGRSRTSVPVTFTVPNPAPTAAMLLPQDGSAVVPGPVELRVGASPDAGTGSPLDFAVFYVDGEYAAFSDDPVNGAVFTAEWWATDLGQHVVTAEVYDVDGWSGTANAISVTVANPPGAPTGVSAVAGLDGTATVSWTAPADDGGSPVTEYRVHRAGLDGGPVGAGTPYAGSPALVTGLTNGTPVAFVVVARNGAAAGAPSVKSDTVTPGTPTAMSIAVSPTTITYGKTVTVTGTLTRTDTNAVLAARPVQLLRCAGATCVVVKEGTTSASGVVTMTYAMPATRDLRLRFNQSGQFLKGSSAAKKVSVRALVTSSISTTSMRLGSTATVYGKVGPAHYGQRAYLQRLTSTGWRNVTYKTQSRTGTVSFAVKPATRGTWTYRVHFAGDADHLAGSSASRSVKVT